MVNSVSLLLVATSILHLLLSASGGKPPADPAVHIAASGEVFSRTVRQPSGEDPSNWLDVVQRAKASLASTQDTAKLMRAEVRKHVPLQIEQAAHGSVTTPAPGHDRLEAALLDLEALEVNCSFMSGNAELQLSPTTTKLCHILAGNNTQVAAKLERTVKGLSLRRMKTNTSEMVVSDKAEEQLLSHLRAALWDMWFCAKRANPPCDPMTSKDGRVQVARNQAFDALDAIHRHAQDTPAGEGQGQPTAAPAALPQVPALLEIGSSSSEVGDGDTDPKPVASASLWATNVINNMLTPGTGEGESVPDKLMNAINNLDIDDELEGDIVKIENDEDGNMRKLKAALLLLHECSSMPACPADNCCTPRTTVQADYKKAREDAYECYHNMEHDSDMAKVAYVDLLKNIAGPTTTKANLVGGTAHAAAGGLPHKHGHHHSGNNSNNTVVEEEKEIEYVPQPTEGSPVLLIVLISVLVVVLIAVGFLGWKIYEEHKAKTAGATAGGEQWGEGGEEQWGQY